MPTVKRTEADGFEMDGNDVSLSLPFSVPPTPKEAANDSLTPAERRAAVERALLSAHDKSNAADDILDQLASTFSLSLAQDYHTPKSFLYIERKPSRLYQYHAEPSPGDLKRIAQGRLRVIGFSPTGLTEFQSDGTQKPVEDFQCSPVCSPRSKSTSTNTATRRVGRKSRRRPEPAEPPSTPHSTLFAHEEPLVGTTLPSEASH